ncbi:MAG: hypothetical protein KC646_05600 [Candidatus Cloacimonetes bacterium]|nr:hypothetical protein [Candidatus Cloacimonadota bacterium]
MNKVKKLIKILLILACGSSVYFYLNYVRISPNIVAAYKKEDTQLLRSIFEDPKYNWYQQACSLEFYSRLQCSVNDPLLQKVLGSHLHQNRLSIFEGCFFNDTRDFLVPRGLKDSYSYSRYTTLKYVQRRKTQDQYKDQLIKMIKKDSSSMVKNQAKILLVDNQE